MNTENKHKTYKKPTIQLYAIRPNCLLADSTVTTYSNAFGGVKQATDINEEEGR